MSTESKDLTSPPIPFESVSDRLNENEERLKEKFNYCSDVIFRPVHLEGTNKALMIYIEGLGDISMMDQLIVQSILLHGLSVEAGDAAPSEQMSTKPEINTAEIKRLYYIEDVVQDILNPKVVILLDHVNFALSVDIPGPKHRSIDEPSSEPVVRGPREGFVEAIQVNTSMLRRKIKNSQLKMEYVNIGQISQTKIAISYLEGIADEHIVQELRNKVKGIKVDSILESAYIEEFIDMYPFSPFPTVQNTERPDVVAASLLEGKVAIFTDGTPFVLIVPFTFWAGLQSAEDYYNRSVYSTAIRLIRIVFLSSSLFLPSLYVAIVNFHFQMLPTSLLLTFATARENAPFPTVVETFIMEVVFEGLREAGIRLPKQIGSAVSIV